jgi:hypothetical protein
MFGVVQAFAAAQGGKASCLPVAGLWVSPGVPTKVM